MYCERNIKEQTSNIKHQKKNQSDLQACKKAIVITVLKITEKFA